MSYTIGSRFKGEHIVYAGYTICTSREHIVYGAFCGSTVPYAETIYWENDWECLMQKQYTVRMTGNVLCRNNIL